MSYGRSPAQITPIHVGPKLFAFDAAFGGALDCRTVFGRHSVRKPLLDGLIAADAEHCSGPYRPAQKLDRGGEVSSFVHAPKSMQEKLANQENRLESLAMAPGGPITKIQRMETLNARIRRLREAKELTQEQLAARVGLSRQAVQKWEEAGGTGPKRTRQKAVADALGVTVEELMHGTTPSLQPLSSTSDLQHRPYSQENTSDGPILASSALVLSWTEAAVLDETITTNFERERIPTSLEPIGTQFALRMEGDSMSPLFPPGSLILVDTGVDAAPGKFVVAVREGQTAAVCKQLVEEGGVRYLKPLNSSYPMYELQPGDRIIGVVRRVGIDV